MRTPRAPTEEQKQRAAERRERFRALAKTVADMTAAERRRWSIGAGQS